MRPQRAPVVEFLVRAAREFRRGGWVFTGFHWPVLAAHLAARLPGPPFAQVFEAGAVCHGAAELVPTSTTDYPAYAGALGFAGATADILLAGARRCDRVVLDAANVDLRGRVNATAVGPSARPRVRLAGGGGAADAAFAAKELVLLHGGDDPRRIVAEVEHVTAAPRPGVPVRLHTRWGVLDLGERPVLREVAGVGDTGPFLVRMAELGVATDGVPVAEPPTRQELSAAWRVLEEAAARGYRAAAAALAAEGPATAEGGDGDG